MKEWQFFNALLGNTSQKDDEYHIVSAKTLKEVISNIADYYCEINKAEDVKDVVNALMAETETTVSYSSFSQNVNFIYSPTQGCFFAEDIILPRKQREYDGENVKMYLHRIMAIETTEDDDISETDDTEDADATNICPKDQITTETQQKKHVIVYEACYVYTKKEKDGTGRKRREDGPLYTEYANWAREIVTMSQDIMPFMLYKGVIYDYEDNKPLGKSHTLGWEYEITDIECTQGMLADFSENFSHTMDESAITLPSRYMYNKEHQNRKIHTTIVNVLAKMQTVNKYKEDDGSNKLEAKIQQMTQALEQQTAETKKEKETAQKLSDKLNACENALQKANKAIRLAEYAAAKQSEEKETTSGEPTEAAIKITKKLQDAERKHRIIEAELEKQKQINLHLKNKLSRPTKVAKIAEWVKSQFSEKLVLHDRAIKLLSNEDENSVNLDVLCDAIEYLAEEYRDHLMKRRSKDEIEKMCSYKYDRPFFVGGNNDSYTGFPEYVVPYGNRESRFLNLHLRYGNTAGNLIRIYFFFDKKTRTIVIGALPRHLGCNKIS